jgi:hypothetical protein
MSARCVYKLPSNTISTSLTRDAQIENAAHLNKVVFRDAAGASVSGRFFSLFPGLGYAAAYKV